VIRVRSVVPSLAAALVLAGCGAPAVLPPPVDPDLPSRWTEAPADSADTDAGTTDALGWWDSFPGEAPRALVAEALSHNRSLAAATARLDAAAAEARIAGADRYPQLSAGGTAARSQQIFVGLPIPGRTGPLTSRSTTYGVSLDVAWEVDLWGRLRAHQSAADADYAASAADWEGARLSLAGQTLKAYFATIESARALELAEAVLASHDRTVEAVGDRYREGVRPSIDLRLAMVDQATARVSLEQARLAHDRATRSLELLLGRYPGAELRTPEQLPTVDAPVPDGLTADLLTRRPDLVAAERRAAAAGRRVSESKRALLPQIRLTGSAGRSSDDPGDLTDADFSVWRIASSLLQPLFQGGRLRANVSRASAAEDAALADWAQATLRACGEVESALFAERSLAAQEDAAAAAAEQADEALSLSRSRYESGLDGILTLLSAQRADAAARARLLQLRRLRLEARVDLHLALGGGFRLDAEAEPEGGRSS
jgi:outer membrane protein, multidrug efflux system